MSSHSSMAKHEQETKQRKRGKLIHTRSYTQVREARQHHAETRDPPSQDLRDHMAFAEWHDDSPLITSKQTTTTPRRNESGEKKGETKSETWCVVTAWHLSSLLLMATKASALCGALPSTPCCKCCSGALPSCTEVFTFARAACALSSACCFLLLSLLHLLASPFCCWPPPAVFPSFLPVLRPSLPASLPVCFLMCRLSPFFFFGLLLCLLVVFLSAVAGLLLICGMCLLPAYKVLR